MFLNEVPDAVLLTEKIVKVSLDDSVGKWCETILDDNIKGIPYGKLEDYDMNLEIKKIEQVYLNTIL